MRRRGSQSALNCVIMRIQYDPLCFCFVLFYEGKKNGSRGPPSLTVHPLVPHNQPWVVFVGRMRRQKWRVKAVSCSRASSEIIPAFLWDHPQKPLAQPAPEGERWGEIGWARGRFGHNAPIESFPTWVLTPHSVTDNRPPTRASIGGQC